MTQSPDVRALSAMTPAEAAFLAAWEKTGKEEGGYVNNPADSGGETNWGITEQVARAHGWNGAMRDLPQARAREIAKEQYWDILKLDEIAVLSLPIAQELFDTGFNAGQGKAALFLQRCLNVLNRGRRDYPDITADGVIGKMTVYALAEYLTRRGKEGETVMLRALNCLQGAFYIELSERREKDEAFTYGWLLRRVELP